MTAEGRQRVSLASGDRRYLTIMFVDLVGYSGLAEELDPEELMAVERRYRQLALNIMERFGGFVGNYYGDGILAYFGYPKARGNDAERAVRAALEMIEQLRVADFLLSDGRARRLDARIGLHTGLVVVGPQLLSAGDTFQGVVGGAVTLAARLQQEAPVNGVVASRQTYNLVEGLFDFEPLGERKLKGLTRTVAIFHAVGEKQGGKPRLLGSAPTMIGRQSVLTRMLACWGAACETSRNQVVEIVGDAGIGKTRLVNEFCAHPAVSGASVMLAQCQEIFAHTAFYVVSSYLWKRAGLALGDDLAARRRKLDELLSELRMSSPENSRIIASFVGPGAAQAIESIAPTPYLYKRKQLDFIVSAFKQVVSTRPSILCVEDVHWLDPSSAELLVEIAQALKNVPFMLVTTTRFFPKGPSLPTPDETIRLEQLSPEDCLSLANTIPGARDLPERVVKRAIEAADGIPLFVEQLVLSLVDQRAQEVPRAGRSADLPLVLAEMLSERLDRRPGGRRIVQAAACMGRSFRPDFLAALLQENLNDLIAPLEGLVEAEILQPKQYGREVQFEFRHALLQQIAHDSIVEPERCNMHARMAEILSKQTDVAPPPEMLAYHFAEAGQFPNAVRHWLAAGLNAVRQSAHLEAIDHFRKGLALLSKIDDENFRRDQELNLQAALIGSITITQGATSQELSACCERGLQLCHGQRSERRVFPFVFGQFTYAICRGRIDDASSLADMFLSIAEELHDEPCKVIGHRLRGMMLLGRCDLAGSRDALRRSLALYSPERDGATTQMYGQNTQVHSQALLSLALLCLGEVEEAIRLGSQTLLIADVLRHPHSTAIALSYIGGQVLGYCGAAEHQLRQAKRLIALSEQHNIGAFRAHALGFLGWALCENGELAKGVELMETAIQDFDSIDYTLGIAGHLANLADGRRRAGRLRDAKTAAARAIEMIDASVCGWCEPEVVRITAVIEGELSSDRHHASGMLWHGAERARQIGMPVFERRCLLSLRELGGDSRRQLEAEFRLRQMAHLDHLPELVDSIMANSVSVE
jgi:class 3 adenylate cyclase/tetratricopeptide (TPR) repeat protein